MLISLHRTKQSTSACWCKLCPGSRAFFCLPNLHLVYICYPRPRQNQTSAAISFLCTLCSKPKQKGEQIKVQGPKLAGKKNLVSILQRNHLHRVEDNTAFVSLALLLFLSLPVSFPILLSLSLP